jgi:hypothetical protein
MALKENHKYNYTCIFYGDDIEIADRIEPVFTYMSIRDDSTAEEIKYEPSMEVVKSDSNIVDVWSPDEEYLVLLRGNFKGFYIIKASEVAEFIRNRSHVDSIRVYEANTETALMHFFGKWDGNRSFIFDAGLSGDNWSFRYDITEQKLTVLGERSDFFSGENIKGKIEPVAKTQSYKRLQRTRR